MVARQHRDKRLRPTVVLLLYRVIDGQYQALLVRGANKPFPLHFPQGGIEPEEDVLQAFYREGFEELALPKEAVQSVEYVGYKVSFKPQRKEHEKFREGSLYFCFAAECNTSFEPTLNEENLEYGWFPFYEARRLFVGEGKKSASVRSHEFLVSFQHKNLF